MTDILTAEQVADLLHCTPETVREKTPHIIPGAKFGRDWVYSRELVVKAVERESMVVRALPDRFDAIRKEFEQNLRNGVNAKMPPSLSL